MAIAKKFIDNLLFYLPPAILCVFGAAVIKRNTNFKKADPAITDNDLEFIDYLRYTQQNPFEILNISPDLTLDEVKMLCNEIKIQYNPTRFRDEDAEKDYQKIEYICDKMERKEILELLKFWFVDPSIIKFFYCGRKFSKSRLAFPNLYVFVEDAEENIDDSLEINVFRILRLCNSKKIQ